MTYRIITKMARLSVLTLCLVGLNLASTGCAECNKGVCQTKQCCGKSGKCQKDAKTCPAGGKSAKKCQAGCKKACCKTAKVCPAGCTKACCKKA